MLVSLPVSYRRQRGRVKAASPAVVMLDSASYDDAGAGGAGGAVLRLRFDRAVNVSSIHVAAITLKDGSFNQKIYQGSGAVVVLDPQGIEVKLVPIGEYAVDEVVLTVTGGNGVVAANDGGVWPGVEGLGVPFP